MKLPWSNNSQRNRRAFSLVELMVSIVISIIVAAGIISILHSFLLNLEQTDDITAARQRGEMVISILASPVLHAGLGMPDEGERLTRAFASGETAELRKVTDRKNVLSVNAPDNGDIYITYAVPSGIVTREAALISGDMLLSPDLSSRVPTNMVQAYHGFLSNTKNWITFPTAGVPFLVTGTGDPEKPVFRAFSGGSGIIACYDELYYVRILRAYVKIGPDGKRVFYTEDPTLGIMQPRVDGVEKIYFKYQRGVLSAFVLCRGNRKNGHLDTGRKIKGWDESILPHIDSDSKKYRLCVIRGSWLVRN